MTEFVITAPVTVTDSIEEAKAFVVEQNLELLKTQYSMLVDPNACFTSEVCEALAEAGILTKEPSTYEKPPTEVGGEPTVIHSSITLNGVKVKLYNYSWLHKELATPSQFLSLASPDLLKQVAWDLRTFPAFCNVVSNG